MPIRVSFFAICVGYFAYTSLAYADFDPSGRKRPKRPQPVRPTHPQTPVDAATIPKKDPIERARVIALARPGDIGPIIKLAQLYRERDGSLEQGLVEWKTKAESDASSKEEQWAALVTYAGLLKNDRHDADAALAYEKARAQKPTHAPTLLALARLRHDEGNRKEAYDWYVKAQEIQKDKIEKETTLRALIELAIDRKDHNAAKKWHAELVRTNGDSMTVRAELARIYLLKGLFEEAETEFLNVAKFAAGDHRALPKALLDVGTTQIKLQKYEDAIQTLRRGLAIAGAQASIRTSLLNAIAEVYRVQNKIEQLVTELEKENPADADRQELLGKLAAEFDAERAIKWLTKALANSPQRAESRLLLIRLLKEQSRIDDAIQQYDALIRSSRNQPQFVFELCDLLISQGERTKALARLRALEASSGSEPEIQQRLAAYYSQIGEDKLALALMERLTKVGRDDPSPIIDLGDFYYQRNQTAKAVETWKKLEQIIRPQAKALVALGEVFLDHDLTLEALTAYRKAMQLLPNELSVQKGFAIALERDRKFREAQLIWEQILTRADLDKMSRREARAHLISTWVGQKSLEKQVLLLVVKFEKQPRDFEAGRLLAEVLLALHQPNDAEVTLRQILEHSKNDIDARLMLERVLVQQKKIPDAIKVLEELVKADPKSARAYYTRLAQYALQLYKDEEALRYAASAVELSPEDAEGHKKLAEMYRSQQQMPRAIQEFRLALQYNPKLWPVYFELAELVLAQGNEVEADTLYRRVIRGAADDELVATAIRLSAAINQKRGSLEVLENELLPLTLANPQKPVYRRLLIELYANLTTPLIARVKNQRDNEARQRLIKIGARGVQPLIDALSDTNSSQKQTAIEILAYVENRSAAMPLFLFATSNADIKLRAQAMLACSALREASLLPKYEEFLLGPPTIPSHEVAILAAFGVTRIALQKSTPHNASAIQKAQRIMLRIADAPGVLPSLFYQLSALTFGYSHDPRFATLLDRLLRRSNLQPSARATIFYALGLLKTTDAQKQLTQALLTSTHPLERKAALWALAHVIASPNAEVKAKNTLDSKQLFAQFGTTIHAITEALLDPNEQVRGAATGALSIVASQKPISIEEPFLSLESEFNSNELFNSILPKTYDSSILAHTLKIFEQPIIQAVKNAFLLSPARSISALDAMLARSTGPSFGVFTSDLNAPFEAAQRISDAAEPWVANALYQPDPDLQSRAIRFLARRATTFAHNALAQFLIARAQRYKIQKKRASLYGNRTEEVIHLTSDIKLERLVVEELKNIGNASTVQSLIVLLELTIPWPLRVATMQTLGAIGQRDLEAKVIEPLEKMAREDPYAVVREAALQALYATGRSEAIQRMKQIATHDSEPYIRNRFVK